MGAEGDALLTFAEAEWLSFSDGVRVVSAAAPLAPALVYRLLTSIHPVCADQRGISRCLGSSADSLGQWEKSPSENSGSPPTVRDSGLFIQQGERGGSNKDGAGGGE
ncbi:hypothetical protein NDU88_002244 [Pleurodeles waltl]|uniref:Uncharacterized protein n=1 Tax=Pleurodeles waltl TaxID=8319 RepID=A0AAV7SEX4_PLEWA|nr:hypothetical protein NDU88_002244 [Pleurodeles waltl]